MYSLHLVTCCYTLHLGAPEGLTPALLQMLCSAASARIQHRLGHRRCRRAQGQYKCLVGAHYGLSMHCPVNRAPLMTWALDYPGPGRCACLNSSGLCRSVVLVDRWSRSGQNEGKCWAPDLPRRFGWTAPVRTVHRNYSTPETNVDSSQSGATPPRPLHPRWSTSAQTADPKRSTCQSGQ